MADDAPGPGHYDQPELLGTGPAASIRGRPVSKRTDDAPGPGQYDQPELLGRGPAASIRGRTTTKLADDVPGPGHYDHLDLMGTGGPAISIRGARLPLPGEAMVWVPDDKTLKPKSRKPRRERFNLGKCALYLLRTLEVFLLLFLIAFLLLGR